jgi:hypothetical protein
MKNIKNKILLCLAVPMLFTACEKSATLDATIEDSMDNKAKVRLYNFSINAPSANFYSDDQKLSATLSANGNEAVAGIGFGGTYPTNQYALAPTGTRTINFVTPRTLATGANLTVASVTHNFVDQKYYSVFTSGIYDAVAKKCDAFVVEDNFPEEMDPVNTYVRIVNPGHNTTTISLVLQKFVTINTVKTLVEEKVIGAEVPYKGASPFVAVVPGAWELLVTDNGSKKTVVRAAVALLKDRVYTFALRGNLVTGTPAPFLDFTTNK